MTAATTEDNTAPHTNIPMAIPATTPNQMHITISLSLYDPGFTNKLKK